ncbi:MAG: META domain-containing protein [Nigerium sp.]|nr:META domain-containing protein [Nigerium sp.]
MSKMTFVVAVAASFLLVGCVQPPPVTASPSPSPTVSAPATAAALIGDPWQLTSLRGVDQTGSTAFLQFGTDGRATGSGGCNRIGGSFATDGSTLSFGGDFVSTMMACEESVMKTEQELLAALPQVASYAITGGRLTLSDAAGAEVATFAVLDQGLAGTSWVVTGLRSGDAVTSPIAGTDLTVAFGEDGGVSGSSGCNRFTGTYTVTDGLLRVGPLVSTMMACDTPTGVMEQETAFLKALESATAIQREVASLTLRTADDTIALTLAPGE